MQPDRGQEARRWLSQAEDDLAAGRVLFAQEFFAHACFQAQQAAEKALKGLRYYHEGRRSRTHQVSGTSGLIKIVMAYEPAFAQFEEEAGILDQYYVPTRYPDAFPGGVPRDMFSRRQAGEALETARKIVTSVSELIREST